MKRSVIQITEENLERIVLRVVEILQEKYGATFDDWVPEAQAMQLLNIKSKSTMLNLRATGQLLYSQPMHKIILYSRMSINQYLSKHARKTF